MRNDYKLWLETQKYSGNTINAQLSRVARVEEYYGDLNDHFRERTIEKIIEELQYSTSDERCARPNPSRIPVEGNIRNNLQSYKNAVVRYQKFLSGWERPFVDVDADDEFPSLSLSNEVSPEIHSQKLSLERDMQAALRLDISQLGRSLTIIDDGAERSVHSGFIDITCEDASDNALVVVELKAGRADSRSIGQILGYMGDIAEEEQDRTVRGILVAHEFDKRSKSAAHVVPALSLLRYSIRFDFEGET